LWWPSLGELLGAQRKLVVVVADTAAGIGQDRRVVTVQDLADPLGVWAEYGHELGGGHLAPLAGEERLEPQQVGRVPWREHRQRAQQAHPWAGRARLTLRAVQPGQLI